MRHPRPRSPRLASAPRHTRRQPASTAVRVRMSQRYPVQAAPVDVLPTQDLLGGSSCESAARACRRAVDPASGPMAGWRRQCGRRQDAPAPSRSGLSGTPAGTGGAPAPELLWSACDRSHREATPRCRDRSATHATTPRPSVAHHRHRRVQTPPDHQGCARRHAQQAHDCQGRRAATAPTPTFCQPHRSSKGILVR